MAHIRSENERREVEDATRRAIQNEVDARAEYEGEREAALTNTPPEEGQATIVYDEMQNASIDWPSLSPETVQSLMNGMRSSPTEVGWGRPSPPEPEPAQGVEVNPIQWEEDPLAASYGEPLQPHLTHYERRTGRRSTYADIVNRYGGVDDSHTGGRSRVNQENLISGNVEVDNNMVTVAQVFGQRASYPTIESHPLIVGQNLAGVEIELENMTGNPPNFQYWEAKSDGSLRNSGMEFVCSSPWGGRDLYNAAIEIDSFLFANNPDESWRCSTHVHVDVRNMNAPQLKRLILAYIVYERILFKCSGWHRYKNNFCVALGFAQDQLAILARAWEQDDENFMRHLAQNWDKYTSLNLLPMGNFGSVEFRISEAKWRKGRLIRLVNRFLSLKELAMNFEGDDISFIEYLMTIPLHQAIRKGLPKTLPDFEQDLEIGYKLAHDVISMSKIRRRRIYTHNVKPVEQDDSRRFRVIIGEEYRNHLTRQLRSRTDGLWLMPETFPDTITFEWLAELQEKCLDMGITFNTEWFTARQLASQHAQLYNEFWRVRRQGGIRPQPAPDYYSEEPDEDDDYESDDDDDVGF